MDLSFTTRAHFRFLVIAGLMLMAVGAVDPLEGAVVILGGSALIVLGALFSRLPYRMPLAALVLIAAGVGSLFGLSALGGVGGSTGRSSWWLLLCAPYPVGWILGLLGGTRALGRHRHEPR